MSRLKTVDDLISELNSEGARKDPVVVPDGKGQDGKRKYAVVFSDERRRFKIARDKVMGEQIEFSLTAAPSAYDVAHAEDVFLGKCRLPVNAVQGVVASFPERSKEQRLRLNLEGHVEQLIESGESSKLSKTKPGAEEWDRRPIVQVLVSYGYLVSSQAPEHRDAREAVVAVNTKNKSKDAREAKDDGQKFVSAVGIGDHTGGGGAAKKTKAGIKNLPGASSEAHWVDVQVLSVRALDVDVCKKYTQLACSVACRHAEDPDFQTAWATSTFHVESVRKARAELDARGYASNRSHHTLDYLSRELGKSTMDMGAAYLELKDADLDEAYAAWQRRQRGELRLWDRLLYHVFGRRHAHSFKSLMMSEEERAREREREVCRVTGEERARVREREV